MLFHQLPLMKFRSNTYLRLHFTKIGMNMVIFLALFFSLGGINPSYASVDSAAGFLADIESGFAGSNMGAHADWYDGGAEPVATASIGVTGSGTLVDPYTVTNDLTCETFDAGWTDGAKIDNGDWYSDNGPTIEEGEGVASSWGISPSGDIFIWQSQAFSWSDSSFVSTVIQLDFETNATAQFDDDRVGWQTTNSDNDSNFFFGVQLDNRLSHRRIEGYWDHVYNSGDNDGRPEIVDLDGVGLLADSWYRLIAEFTKLTASSAKIDVELWSLDGSGNPVTLTASGSLADTSTLGSSAPNASPAAEYFTTANLYPAFHNYTGSAAANADNACYQVKSILETTITSMPTDPTYSTEATFTFTSNEPGATFECQLDGSSFSTCTSPKVYASLSNGTYNFQVRAIGSGGPDPTPASFTWTIDTSLLTDMIGYWAFDEDSGSVANDSSDYNNHGTVVNGATWTSGQVNGALNFDGIDDYVQVPASSSMSTVTDQVTLATWIYADTLAEPWEALMSRSNAAITWFDWQLYARDAWSSSFPTCRIDWNGNGINDADEVVVGDIVLQTDTWYHIACTYDGTALKLYIDGTLRDTTLKSDGTIPNSARDVRLGANETWGANFDGIMDESYIYNRALSEAGIQSLRGTCHALTLSHSGQGSDPGASPANSSGCPAGQYVAGEAITLSGAVPDSGWNISSWTGADNDTSTAGTNTLTMPAGDHGVSVNYSLICFELNLSHSGQGSDPLASPTGSSGCPFGEYVPGETINLSSAVPDSGWNISSWTGTGNDASTASTNTLTMPGSAHVVSVNYSLICFELTLTHSGQGSDPLASPTSSSGCPVGEYVPGETINLSSAVPDSGWNISSWTGTGNDASTASTNTLTMPGSAHVVSVNYRIYLYLPIVTNGAN